MEWDTHWRWQRFLGSSERDPPQRRPLYRAFVTSLAPQPGAAVLDASAGLGDSLVLLRRAGFDADGCDASHEAVEATREAVTAAGFDARVFRARWEELGRVAPRRYEVILNDALSWVPDDARYCAALVGLRTALVGGGRLCFIGANDRHPEAGYGRVLLTEKWARIGRERFSLVRSRSTPARSVAHLVARERGDTWIDEHHVYVILEDGSLHCETARLRQPFHRDWPDVSRLVREAGFVDLRCEELKLGNQVVVVNLAQAP